MQARCDLHLHSDASDGSVPPDQLAANLGHVHLAVLTDHDTLAGSAAFAKVVDSELPVPDGVEISLRWESGTFHLLVYGNSLARTELATRIDELAVARQNRNLELLDRANQYGLSITEEEVLAVAGTTDFQAKSVGRPHFARVLVDHGYAESIQDAFDRYLAKGRPLYSPKTLFGFDEIGPLCADLGLVAVVAHPFSLGLPLSSLASTLADYRRIGLVGLECLYAGYTPEQRTQLTQIARDLDLLVTGGSDYHGTFKPGLEPLKGFGDLVVPAEVGDRLLESLNRS
ncbi:PHP domain-containing protein [Ferrimicrobium sp.]|uniref:PHP domain-containing protein n=1 Tax=Ferrimicrobium sp. TaxID=2926050 RepID=UPI00261D0848|nr:PHP domain-containing protein [Ferrimicrobium sp.]